MPKLQSLQCNAHLDRDKSEVLHDLNAVLGGFEYVQNLPLLAFKLHGKPMTVHSQKTAMNALGDEEEAEETLEWFQREIDEIWGNPELGRHINASNFGDR